MPLNFHDLQCEFTYATPENILFEWTDISVTLYAVVTITTIYRIHLRYRTRLWYWDDLFALIGTSCMTLFIVGENLDYSVIQLKFNYVFRGVPSRKSR